MNDKFDYDFYKWDLEKGDYKRTISKSELKYHSKKRRNRNILIGVVLSTITIVTLLLII